MWRPIKTKTKELTEGISKSFTSVRTDKIDSTPRVLTTDVIGRPSRRHGDGATIVTSSMTTTNYLLLL